MPVVTLSPKPESASATTAVPADAAATSTAGRVREIGDVTVDVDTGEIVEEQPGYEDYEHYLQESERAMREEEKNILSHGHEHDDDDEPDREGW
jgi:hypothetical protein